MTVTNYQTGGIGMFVELAFSQYARENVGQLVLGVQVRIPAVVGLAWAWLK
ncbi:hypothetical protein BH09MYX1_BH09MYX1_30440 [soil metagenome]